MSVWFGITGVQWLLSSAWGGVEGKAEVLDGFGEGLTTGDFDGDGFADLVVAAPLEGSGAVVQCGAVHVLYGGPGRLSDTDDQLWHQDTPGVEETAELGDRFGGRFPNTTSLAVGDFNGDGADDLVVGSYGESVNGFLSAGGINVLYGTVGVGLTATGDQHFHEDSPGLRGTARSFELFGFALAAGDFDGDGFADVAVGAHEDYSGVAPFAGAGRVHVLYGSVVGLTGTGADVFDTDTGAIQGEAESPDGFGFALAAGDFDANGADDLAIGAPDEGFRKADFAGAVHVLFGTVGVGLGGANNQLFTQTDGGVDDREESDSFGESLAVGDFDGDGIADLAVGATYERVGQAPHAAAQAGAVSVLFGAAGVGLTDRGERLWTRDSPGLSTSAQDGDNFGQRLATADFDGDGVDDLAVAAPSGPPAGSVLVLYGVAAIGLTALDHQEWNQAVPGVDDEPGNESFGAALAAADFDGDGFDDVVIGVPTETVGPLDVSGGAVHVLYGSVTGVVAAGSQFWHQDQ